MFFKFFIKERLFLLGGVMGTLIGMFMPFTASRTSFFTISYDTQFGFEHTVPYVTGAVSVFSLILIFSKRNRFTTITSIVLYTMSLPVILFMYELYGGILSFTTYKPLVGFYVVLYSYGLGFWGAIKSLNSHRNKLRLEISKVEIGKQELVEQIDPSVRPAGYGLDQVLLAAFIFTSPVVFFFVADYLWSWWK